MRVRKEVPSVGALISGQMTSSSSHPAAAKITFSPGHHRGRNGAPRPPKMPERPIAAYVRYTQKVWETVKTQNPEMKMWEVSRLISKMWREAAESERQSYVEEHEHLKAEYHERISNYYRSSQYQNYLQAKQRWDAAELRDDDDMHFSMEPVDDIPTDDNVFSHRALCAARFHRNKYLMLDILNDHVVTNNMKITQQIQLNSLSCHRERLVKGIDKYKTELQKTEDEHEERKRKWKNESDDLNKEWKRLASMSPIQYFAEFKAKQDAAKLAREDEERKRKENEEKQNNDAQKSNCADHVKLEKNDLPKDVDENCQDVTLETMENKALGDEPKVDNPIDAMHQMVSMAGSFNQKLPEEPMETDMQNVHRQHCVKKEIANSSMNIMPE